MPSGLTEGIMLNQKLLLSRAERIDE